MGFVSTKPFRAEEQHVRSGSEHKPQSGMASTQNLVQAQTTPVAVRG